VGSKPYSESVIRGSTKETKYDELGTESGSFISLGGIGYNNFRYAQAVIRKDSFLGKVITPRSGTNVATINTGTGDNIEGSLFTTGRCFKLESFYWACTTFKRAGNKVVGNPVNSERVPAPCVLTLTPYGARFQEFANKTITFAPALGARRTPMVLGKADVGPAKMIRISVAHTAGNSGLLDVFFDDVTYSQFDNSVIGLASCPEFSDL
jgi:hypothetical protein